VSERGTSSSRKPGDEVVLEVERNPEKIESKVKLAERP
jgi:hypothetical protein